MTHGAERPRLKHCTFVIDQDRLLATTSDGVFTVDVLDGAVDDFLKLKANLNGLHTIEEIAKITRLQQDNVTEAVSALGASGLLREKSSTEEFISREVFVRKLSRSVRMWKNLTGMHPLFQRMLYGEATRELFAGLVIETYHYVRGTTHHAATALAHCYDEKLRPLILSHLSEESEHELLILSALSRMGLDRQAIIESEPLIGTTSLLNYRKEIGRKSSLAYLATTLFTEEEAGQELMSVDELVRMAKIAGFSKDVVEPIAEHILGDAASNHSTVFFDAIRSSQISQQFACEMVEALHNLRHAFEQYYDGILSYYGTNGHSIPRAKTDWFSL